MEQHQGWVRFEEEEGARQEEGGRRGKGDSSSSSLSSSPSSSTGCSTTMEQRMADFEMRLDVEQLAAAMQDKYAVLQLLHCSSDLGWSSAVRGEAPTPSH
jgi:hypothetical protein